MGKMLKLIEMIQKRSNFAERESLQLKLNNLIYQF